MWPKHAESYRAHEAGHTQLVVRRQNMRRRGQSQHRTLRGLLGILHESRGPAGEVRMACVGRAQTHASRLKSGAASRCGRSRQRSAGSHCELAEGLVHPHHPDLCCHLPISSGCFRCSFLPDTARCWGQACLSSQQCQEPAPPAWVICGPGRPTARLVGTECPLVPGDRLAVQTHACSAACRQMGDRVPGCRCWQPSALWLSRTPFSLRVCSQGPF